MRSWLIVGGKKVPAKNLGECRLGSRVKVGSQRRLTQVLLVVCSARVERGSRRRRMVSIIAERRGDIWRLINNNKKVEYVSSYVICCTITANLLIVYLLGCVVGGEG